MNASEIIFTLSKTARIFKAVALDFISDNTEMLTITSLCPKILAVYGILHKSVLRDVQASESIMTWVQRDVQTPRMVPSSRK